ncbi:hypothetical protein J2Z58_001606 [Halobacillus andaensis]|nr:hypothetical protein [Halobacillus andaensis]
MVPGTPRVKTCTWYQLSINKESLQGNVYFPASFFTFFRANFKFGSFLVPGTRKWKGCTWLHTITYHRPAVNFRSQKVEKI